MKVQNRLLAKSPVGDDYTTNGTGHCQVAANYRRNVTVEC